MAPGPTLADLPVELFLQIISDERLSRRDWKALRLACPRWAHHVAYLLFRRICISRLRKDRSNFVQIATTPHLAAYVRQLVWYELDLEMWTFQTAQDMEMTSLMKKAAGDLKLFWLPLRTNLTLAHEDEAVRSFSSPFTKALNLLPNLNTFISCAMPGDRILSHYDGYTLQAGLYIVNQTTSRIIGGNDGFFVFMLPELRRRSQIKSLQWAEEGTDTSLYRLRSASPHGFSALTSIDLCIGNSEEISLRRLALCLSGAEELRHLSLCFERALHGPGHQVFLEAICQLCDWPYLTSLHLGGVQLPWDSLGPFCRRHYKYLRHLTLVMCEVTVPDLVLLRGRPSEEDEETRDKPILRLDSITIRSDDDEFTCLLPQEAILPFVNRTSSYIDHAPGEIRTEISIYDHHTHSTAAYFDSQLDEFHHAYSNTALREISGEEEEEEDSDSEYDSSSNGDFKDTQEKTYWAWGRLSPSGADTYYWQVPDAASADAATTAWEFAHRDGRRACGDDPLEYFSDWESGAGDAAAPTPYCEALEDFVGRRWRRRNDNDDDDDTPSEEEEEEEEDLPKQPPSGAGARRYSFNNPWTVAKSLRLLEELGLPDGGM
ncbi:hypothetical protein Hte_003261 [Hypoxylon texense]